MGGRKQVIVVGLVLALAMSTWAPVSLGAKKPSVGARKEDVPYIKCQVCEKLASELHRQVRKKQAQITPKKVSEYQIIEIVENVCNLKEEEADWIMKIDIVEQGDRLELVDQEEEGMCNSECKTVEKACQEVIGYSDTDVGEYIYSSKPDIESLVNYVCKDLTGACSKKPPPVPKDRTPGEPFVPKPSKDAEMEKIMRSMQGMPGAPGMKMYSREDLMSKNFGNEDDDDADEEDEYDDDSQLRSNLGKAMRDNHQKRKEDDWKQKITRGVMNTGETLKKHAKKVSNRIQQWWKAKKGSKASKSEL